MTAYEEFLEQVWGDLEGYVDIALMHKGEVSNHKFFSWPDQKADLFHYVEKHKDEDVYFTPCTFVSPSRRRSLAKGALVVYGDADEFNNDDFLVEPSITVHTSEGKTHVYWLIEDLQDAAVAESLAHSVSEAHPKAKTGYDNGWSCTKLLRVPGTVNRKYAGKEPYVVGVEFTGVFYTHEEFTEHYPEVEAHKAVMEDFPEKLPTKVEVLSSIQMSTRLDGFLNSNRFDKGSKGSEALYGLYTEMFRLGATNAMVFVIAKDSPLNKWDRDNFKDADERLWEDILRARAKDGIIIEGDEEEESEDTIVTVAPRAKSKGYDFLTPSEKDKLGRTFVDEYLSWAKSKTDAAEQYHIAGAFTVLSTVFSDFGHAVPHWGEVPLNLWFMVLGSTTLSRKSTAKSLMLKCIEAMEGDDYNYDLGSKFTAEGLDEALRQSANRSALLHRDEIQGFMKEIDSKAYLAGIKGELTEIYDGKVTGKLRASGEDKDKKRKGARVALNLFTMGIRDQLADYLTLEDFQSGFLTRFVYVSADALQRSAATDYIGQMDENERSKGDPAFNTMIERLKVAREAWEAWNDPTERTIAVPMDKAAHDRYNKFVTDALDAAQAQSKATILEASASRLNTSVLKAATVLAMADRCDEVELKHMLAAINYCGQWFEHMVAMTDRISESEWKRHQDGLADLLVERGGSLTYKQAYRSFSSTLRPRQFLEVVQALEDAGRIMLTNDKKAGRVLHSTEI